MPRHEVVRKGIPMADPVAKPTAAKRKSPAKRSTATRSATPKAPKTNTIAHLASVQLMAYLDNPQCIFDLPFKLGGSKHQLDVWQAMQEIVPGSTLTYGQLAVQIASSPRAVGTACGKNPLPIVVPCHRVVAAGGLGGFMGGKQHHCLAIKRWLLAHENAQEDFSLF